MKAIHRLQFEPTRDLSIPAITAETWAEMVEAERVRRARLVLLVENSKKARERELQRCAEDKIHWLTNWVWILNPKKKGKLRTIPLILWRRQVELIDTLDWCIAEEEDLMILKGRELGVSWICLLSLLHPWVFDDDGILVTAASRVQNLVTGHSMDSLFSKLRYALTRLPRWMQPEGWVKASLNDLLKNPRNDAEIVGVSTTGDIARGGRRDVIVIDEYPAIDGPKQEEIMTGVETPAACLVRCGTPKGRGNRFFADWQVMPEQNRITIPWWSDRRRDHDWLDSTLRENGGKLTLDERDQEHGISFRAVSGHRIWRVGLQVAYEDLELPLDRDSTAWKLAAGMDFGSGPSSTTFVLALCQYGSDGKLLRLWVDFDRSWKRIKAATIGADILGQQQSYGVRPAVYGDPTGISKEGDHESLISRLQAAGVGIAALPVDANNPAGRTESIEEVMEWMEEGRLLIHRTRAAGLLDAMDQWEWSITAGHQIEMMDRETIQPRKDDFSHSCDALRYVMYAAKRYHLRSGRRAQCEETTELPTTIEHELGAIESGLVL